MSGDWWSRAACRTEDPDLFFGAENEGKRTRRARVAKAKAVCLACPSRAACQDFAVKSWQLFGIWGGEDFELCRRMCRNHLHLMDSANTYTDPDGHWNCRACRNAYDQRACARQRQEGEAA